MFVTLLECDSGHKTKMKLGARLDTTLFYMVKITKGAKPVNVIEYALCSD